MTFLTDFATRAQAVSGHRDLDVVPGELLAAVRALSDDDVLVVFEEATAVMGCLERLTVVTAAVIAERSAAPHGGLAGTRGHRSPVALIQEITGGSRVDATRAVRVGASLLDEGCGSRSTGDGGEDERMPQAAIAPWHAGLRQAMLAGAVTTAQHDAIRRGLGEPPDSDDAKAVWAVAAEQLMGEVPGLPVEEVAKRARAVRDALDPVGAEDRFARRFQGRSWRMWTDGDGAHHARIDFDDEMFAWVDSIIGAALRPRRGGPRFMTEAERADADSLVRDGRTNEQLTYDLMMDVVRAGALASAEDVFGARQPGVRLVAVRDAVGARDAFGRLLGVAHVEDGGAALPGSVLDKALCETARVVVSVDGAGNPLDVGREQRLFTAKQRLALAARDGGCMWPGCDRPPSYCEAHHSDHWCAQQGRTDVDRGILLCRFHHLLLHNQGWKITRDGRGPFLLHPPGGEPIVLRSKSPVRWAWEPPPDRAGWRAALTEAHPRPERSAEVVGGWACQQWLDVEGQVDDLPQQPAERR
ncbi:HNH endonuclease signature motif containing protein [Microbacterium sp. zg.Y909]|uniref:HNH endonuclease signature motif containing protein n=1 Tax=Microbacterium sp. zg.Y909 TaxID=2969413 RepID=UPI00214B5870|nr:HNH endonuclease signature motif containing protein [Microbacterium sp. zg.Y909]MCR2826643.1 HNH endonuclease [Microbacterium sp. zg.Y909]